MAARKKAERLPTGTKRYNADDNKFKRAGARVHLSYPPGGYGQKARKAKPKA